MPDTIYVGIGAVVAAFLTGVFGSISLINGKEGKISEFRQSWIDSLREDISTLIGLVEHFSTGFQRIKCELETSDGKIDSRELVIKVDEYTKKNRVEMSILFQRILLRLNPVEHIDLITSLKDVETVINDIELMTDKDALRDKTGDVIAKTQHTLKKEWKRVKCGETSYRYTKWFTIGIVFVLVSLIGVGYLSIPGNEKIAVKLDKKELTTVDKRENKIVVGK